MKSKAFWCKSPTESVWFRCRLGGESPTSAVKAHLNEGPSLNAFNQNPWDLQKQRWHLAGMCINHAKGEIAVNAAGQQVRGIWEGFFQGGITTSSGSGWKGTNNELFESLSQWFVTLTWPRVSGWELVPSTQTSPVVFYSVLTIMGSHLLVPALKLKG